MFQLKLVTSEQLLLLVLLRFITSLSLVTSNEIHEMNTTNISSLYGGTNVHSEDRRMQHLLKKEGHKRDTNHESSKDVDEVDILIIGAGWAGLSAAAYLLQQKPTPTIAILEANNYIGGRSRSSHIGDEDETIAVDLGSEYIESHTYKYTYDKDKSEEYYFADCDEEPMSEISSNLRNECPLAEDINFSGINFKDTLNIWSYFRAGEGKMSDQDSYKLWNKLWSGKDGFLKYETEIESEIKESTRERKVDKSVQDVINGYEEQIDATSKEKKYVAAVANTHIGIGYAEDLDKLSVLESEVTGKYHDAYGGVYTYPNSTFMGGNFGKLAFEFANCDAFSGNAAKYVQLRSRVKRVRYSHTKDKVAKIDYIDESGETKNYKQINAKAVLSTVSLGVLKAGTIKFRPKLPTKKQDIINGMSYATLDKWIALWKNDTNVPWDDDIENTHEMSLIRKKEHAHDKFNVFYNQYYLNGKHKILTGYIHGRGAMLMENRVTKEIHKSAMYSLSLMFPNSTVPAPFEYKVTRWNQHKSFKGSYSAPRVGRNFNQDSKELGRRTGNLFFAGEATSIDWQGTVSGAFNSGHRTASIILKLLFK